MPERKILLGDWPKLAEDQSVPESPHAVKLVLLQGDITTQNTDAIVNAANESLLGGGGVDGAIHYAAGPKLVAECRTLGGCEIGDAKITRGYNLPAKNVIHTVGPIYDDYPPQEAARLLASCYRRSLDVAKQNGLSSIAFPAISTGIFGYPRHEAAQVVHDTVYDYLQTEGAGSLTEVRFVLFSRADYNAYDQTFT